MSKTKKAKRPPNPDQIKKLELKQEQQRRSFRYTRFLPLRYALAIFCFSNLYWATNSLGGGFAWLIPGALFLLGSFVVLEQIKLLGLPTLDITDELKHTTLFFKVQLIANFFFIAIILSGFGFDAFYPFLTNYLTTRLVLAGIVSVGSLLAAFCLRRIAKIKTNTDKHYHNIIAMEEAVGKNKRR